MFRAAVAFRAALSGLCLKGEGIVLMRLVRIVCCALLVFPLGEHCFGQSRPCFAFLLGGDVTVACDGRATKITNLGNVESFAITEEQSSLGYTTSRLTGRSESTTVYAYTATVVDLNTGKSRMIDGVRGVVNTCGGLFSIHHVGDLLSSTRELVSGAELEFRLYDWFRCSSDRKTVVGSTRETGADLLEGLRTGAKIAAAGDFSVYDFNVSPSGAKVAYINQLGAVCVLSPSSLMAECSATGGTLLDNPSVNDSGGVLIAAGTSRECFYRTSTNFSTKAFPGAANMNRDECLGIGYWRSGLKSIEIIQPIGCVPQWINRPMAALLDKFSANLTHKSVPHQR